jgi:hypothetical protein
MLLLLHGYKVCYVCYDCDGDVYYARSEDSPWREMSSTWCGWWTATSCLSTGELLCYFVALLHLAV